MSKIQTIIEEAIGEEKFYVSMIKTEIAYNEGYNLALADLKNKIPEIEKRIIESVLKETRSEELIGELVKRGYCKVELI
jgi:hypothetical protein